MSSEMAKSDHRHRSGIAGAMVTEGFAINIDDEKIRPAGRPTLGQDPGGFKAPERPNHQKQRKNA